MSVFKVHTNAALMHFATIRKVLTIVHVNLDFLEKAKNAKVNVLLVSNHVIKRKNPMGRFSTEPFNSKTA